MINKNKMKVLIFWDIYWRIWRNAFLHEYKNLVSKYNPDFTIVNVDNISSWKWPIEKHLVELEKVWVDLMTSWDHVFDNLEKIREYLNKSNPKLIRACNYFENEEFKIPWVWYRILEKNDKKLLVIHLISTSWMKDNAYNPFLKLQELLKDFDKTELDGIVVDFHKEFTSEIYWLAMSFDWEISFAYWTHTHIQSNDELILDSGTWLINDVWMSWSLHSVIWATLDSVKQRFFTWINKWKIVQSLDKRYVVSWVFVEIEDKKCVNIEKIRIKWQL